jgi:regulatory protein
LAGKLTSAEARQKIYRYCSYQERCHQEVRNKLYEMGLRSAEVDDLIIHLISEGFLNEERFARAFAGGKFRIKKWGRIKITHALEGKGVSLNCIKIGLKEIDESQYHDTLIKILEKKKAEMTGTALETRNRIAKYAVQKGFEPDLVWHELRVLIPD